MRSYILCGVFVCFCQLGFSKAEAYGSLKLFNKFPNKFFIESGTWKGDGIQQAIDTGMFDLFYSIELSESLYEKTKQRFANNSSVSLWKGDSGVVLEELLKGIDAPATFWLDGHYSAGDTALGSSCTPILKELECIKNHSIKTHVILIDDIRQFGTEAFDFISFDTIVNLLLEINPNYKIALLDCDFKDKDVLAAFP